MSSTSLGGSTGDEVGFVIKDKCKKCVMGHVANLSTKFEDLTRILATTLTSNLVELSSWVARHVARFLGQ